MNAWREQVAFRCDDVRFVPDQNSQVGYLVPAQLKQQSMERHVAPLGQTILIRSQPLNAVCLAEKQQIYCTNFIIFGWQGRGYNPRSIVLEASTQTITPSTGLQLWVRLFAAFFWYFAAYH